MSIVNAKESDEHAVNSTSQHGFFNATGFFKSNKPLYQKLDKAWQIYQQGTEHIKYSEACKFLCYALNIAANTTSSEQEIKALMTEREKIKDRYPEYIPNRRLTLPSLDKLHTPTGLANEIQKGKIREVKPGLVIRDQVLKRKMFDALGRAPYRVLVADHKLVQGGELFSTEQMKAHNKRGLGAYTVNQYGELSIFSHQKDADNIVHSSLNSGAPVYAAGELMVIRGELILLNTYSGHYRPNLFTIYHALRYFEAQGVEINNTKIHTSIDVIEKGFDVKINLRDLDLEEPYVDERGELTSKERFFEFTSMDFLNALKKEFSLRAELLENKLAHYTGDKSQLFFGQSNTWDNYLAELKLLKNNFNEAATFNEFDTTRKRFKRLCNVQPLKQEMSEGIIENTLLETAKTIR